MQCSRSRSRLLARWRKSMEARLAASARCDRCLPSWRCGAHNSKGRADVSGGGARTEVFVQGARLEVAETVGRKGMSRSSPLVRKRTDGSCRSAMVVRLDLRTRDMTAEPVNAGDLAGWNSEAGQAGRGMHCAAEQRGRLRRASAVCEQGKPEVWERPRQHGPGRDAQGAVPRKRATVR